MSKATSRRNFLKGLTAGAIVLGFNPLRRSWVTSAEAAETIVGLPRLDGQLVADEASREHAADDFGHIVHRKPRATLRPGSVDDVIRMVRWARDNNVPVAPGGMRHTPYGQSQVEAGICIDMRQLSQIHSISADRAVVDAGVLWRDLLIATLECGLTPPVLTDFIWLTVGGTLSVGGVSGTAFRHGLQIDNVLELEVVTGEGELVSCSPTCRSDLFEAALAGLGQCCIIIRATVRLIPAKQRVLTTRFFYPDIASLDFDMRRLVADERFDNLSAYVLPGPEGWVYFIEGSSYYSGGSPHTSNLLSGLRYIPGTEQSEDRTYFEYCDRVTGLVEGLKAAGLFGLAHPWLDLLVPGSQAGAFVSGVLSNLTPADLGPGFPILLFPLRTSRLSRPLFAVPAKEEVVYLFDILRSVPTDPAILDGYLQANRRLYEQNRQLGGKYYTISAVPMTQHDWKQHFGKNWGKLVSAKRRFDPSNILTPGPGIFPR
jgi:FAD/FMN-containing dehydrogenase